MDQQELERLLDSIADAAFASTPDGTIAGWNQGAETLFGLTRRETRGKTCHQIVQGADGCGPVCSETVWCASPFASIAHSRVSISTWWPLRVLLMFA
jgi:PAS domain-containing protein